MHELTKHLYTSLRKYERQEDYERPYDLTFGTDPEIYAEDSDGIPRSLIGKIGGSKEKPLPVKDGAVQEDNVSAEFNTDPVTTMADFYTKVSSVRDQVYTRIKQHGLTPVVKASAFFPAEELTDPKAAEFGCEPDYCVWTGEQNPTPKGPEGLRSFAGHVHIGFSCDRMHSNQLRQNVSKADLGTLDSILVDRTLVLADLYIGTPSVILDDDNKRRVLYGKAGAYRLKGKGKREPLILEYRTPSNFWITSKERIDWMFKQMKLIATANLSMTELETLYPDPQIIQDCINTGDTVTAKKLIKEYDIVMPVGEEV